MRRAVNIRLDESMILLLDRLSSELETTKTEIIERSIRLFSKQKNRKKDDLLQFAGVLQDTEANRLLEDIKTSRVSKDFSLDNL